MNTFAVFSVLLGLAVCVRAYGHHQDEEHDSPAKYHFDYGVHDPHTGDKKEQYEDRDGHHVKGSYSFKEADGTIRVVDYIAGPHSGFNAVVKRIGHAYHPQNYGKHHGGAHGGGHGGHGGAQSHVGTTHFGYHY